ncbi:hypothetical protein HanXRQr2_Chr03g0094421 [Helianthus annuus]|uniref:Uncharacterized protein n=1 Tax=Helianthus annuus TaxID=4232 RepID=A0A9K3NUG7_HELAN|nr:hypothetical protein HanXRQr2_Chr03g0094421 [Helianthus annuus]KAJ0591924.1 hypothetical protein HanHA300_Chr03g0078941 [Helianthus annuus]KAJ0606897.1 hypothetical protein HanHA89_Chr03g0090311 [Helianthus annuus]KAJ0766962.1 hypothetical protein HanLR1_Chr03g0083621 [Helianthus annuus]
MFNDGKINALTRKVSLLEKGKAEAEAELKATKEKLKDVEAENVALKNEVEELTDVVEELVEKIIEVNVQYKAMDDSNKTLTELVGDLHTSTTSENEVLKKELEALRADKEIKDEQLNMLYTVIENKLGINVQAAYDEIEIQRVEARRMEREKRIVVEAAEALKNKRKGLFIDKEEIHGSTSQPEPSQADEVEVNEDIEVNLDIIPVGEVKDVIHSEFASLRRIEVERRQLKEKLNKYKVVDDDKELNEMFGDEDEDDDKVDKDNKDDKNDKNDKDDDDQNGASGLLIAKPSGPSSIEDFLNGELNEQHEEDQHQGESSSEEDGELVENWTRESMLDRLDLDEDRFKFDIEEEIPPTPDREYTFKFVNEADNFNDVIIEEGSDSDQDTPFHYSGLDDDFHTFDELFRSHNVDEVRRKVVEKIATEGILETVSDEDLLEEKK